MGRILTTFVKRWDGFCERSRVHEVLDGIRGLYVLYDKKSGEKYEAVYIGQSARKPGIKARLKQHDKEFGVDDWSHFSVFESRNDTNDLKIEDLIRDIEGIIRHIFWSERDVLKLNKARGFDRLKEGREPLKNWR